MYHVAQIDGLYAIRFSKLTKILTTIYIEIESTKIPNYHFFVYIGCHW